MNNSKKLKAKKVKEVKLSEKPITSISKPWIITSIVLIVALIGALLFDQLYQPTLMKIDGKKYHLRDVSFYFYNVESSYDYYNQMLGGKYWDQKSDEKSGKTIRDLAKEEAINSTIRYEVLYKEALSNGYKLTSDEKKTISQNVDSLLNGQITKDIIKKNNFTKAYLTKMLSRTTLGDRYRKDQIKALKIDEDKIKAGISTTDYREYKIETIYASTQSTDADGKLVDFTDKQKKTVYDKLNSYYDKAKSSSDWSKLVPTKETDLRYKEDSFIKSDTTYSEDFENMMMKMNNGDISEIYTDKTGYYIVRMKDNNAKDRYESAVQSAITNEENSKFDDLYKSKILTKHKYNLNNKALGHLKMGSITIGS